MILALSGLWVIAVPAGDHPVVAAIEMVIGPERFMTPSERADYFEAAAVERRHKDDVERLYAIERQSRWKGGELTSDEVRRIASMQQRLSEVGRGESFVVDYLRTRHRSRER